MKQKDPKLCIACGNEALEHKSMCEVCQCLVDESFYEIPTEIKAKRYAKKYLKKDLNYKERKYIKDLYKDKSETHVIGTMPSQCPFCFRMSKNQGEFVFFEKGSKEFKRHVENKEKLTAVCGPCGNLAHFFKEFYDLDSDEINLLLKEIKNIKETKIQRAKSDGRKTKSTN